MNILVACEESQAVTKAFRAKGHNAFSCDILPCSGGHPEWHIQGDVMRILSIHPMRTLLNSTNDRRFRITGWDMVIAHPPCTYMSAAGARWMYRSKGVIDEDRYCKAMLAKKMFMDILNCGCPRVVVENPTPLRIIGLPKHTQSIHPYEHGHPFSKRTNLWLKGVPPLVPTNILKQFVPFMSHRGSRLIDGKELYNGNKPRGADRSKTFPGIAQAMADQWG